MLTIWSVVVGYKFLIGGADVQQVVLLPHSSTVNSQGLWSKNREMGSFQGPFGLRWYKKKSEGKNLKEQRDHADIENRRRIETGNQIDFLTTGSDQKRKSRYM